MHFESYSSEAGLSPPGIYYTDRSKAVLLLFYFCFVFVMLSRLLIAALWSPAGKVLTSWLSFVVLNCVVVTFPFDILGQV